MSNNEAKFLLNAYRPNGADATDPSFTSALEQAKSDPQVAAWFAQEQAHAAAIASKLREIAPPPGLRDAILAGGHATERASKRGSNQWRWLAIAAGIAIIAALGATLWPRTVSATQLTAFALNDVVHGRHGGHGPAESALETTLGSTTTRLSGDLPVDFEKLAATGCRTLTVSGHEVLEVCFVRQGVEFHCYIAWAADFDHAATEKGARFIQQGALAAATWTHGAFRYVVAGQAGIDDIKRLL
jgi:hypothetical protein